MKIFVEFDGPDFEQMLESFFKEAGYSVIDLPQAARAFRAAFPAGLRLEVVPSGESTVPAAEVSPLSEEVLPALEQLPAVEEETVTPTVLTRAQLISDAHSDEDPQIRSILALSRELERTKP